MSASALLDRHSYSIASNNPKPSTMCYATSMTSSTGRSIAQSPIGYFAVLYKRVLLPFVKPSTTNVFDDGRSHGGARRRLRRRYFDALNAYFYPDQSPGPTLPWEVAFVGDQDRQAIILQHMMAGLNAHITFDLGLASWRLRPTRWTR